MSAIGSAVRALVVNLHSVGVPQRAGVLNLLAPADLVRASRAGPAIRRDRRADADIGAARARSGRADR